MQEIEYPEVTYADSFEEGMWGLIRLWLDAASASMQLHGGCCSFSWVHFQICEVLGRGYLRRVLTGKEIMQVWDALVEAQYPGWFQGRG